MASRSVIEGELGGRLPNYSKIIENEGARKTCATASSMPAVAPSLPHKFGR